MNKRSGPPLRKEVPPLVKCSDCNGVGTTDGVAHDLDCIRCNETGVLHKETGEIVPAITALRAAKKVIAQQREQIRSLLKLLEKHNIEPDRYGDLKTRFGGKFRGD